MASGPITSWEIDGETMEKQCQTLFFWAPKSLKMVTAAMKLKDAYSLEGKLCILPSSFKLSTPPPHPLIQNPGGEVHFGMKDFSGVS